MSVPGVLLSEGSMGKGLARAGHLCLFLCQGAEVGTARRVRPGARPPATLLHAAPGDKAGNLQQVLCTLPQLLKMGAGAMNKIFPQVTAARSWL
jgi:hypothetical protein